MQMVLGWVLPSQAEVPAGILAFPRDMLATDSVEWVEMNV